MGQYYHPYIEELDGTKTAYDTRLDDVYVFAKLTEHSWLKNGWVNAVAEKLWLKPARIAWIGDYADSESSYPNKNEKFLPEAYSYVYKMEEDVLVTDLKSTNFEIEGCRIVNHTKKEYFDIDKYVSTLYVRRMAEVSEEDVWIVHPLPLLVAQGNGLGGGDYHGINTELVGKWAFDVISIVPKFVNYKGYEEIFPVFCDE